MTVPRAPSRGPRLVVSFATIPSRIGSIGPVIDSLRSQTRGPNRVYVCICEHCEYEGRGYDVPTWLLDDPMVHVAVAPRDYGPANKLLGMLPLEREPDTRIVIVDDDWLCNPDLLENLERRFVQTERTAIGLSGARLPRRWRHMDTRIGAEIRTRPPLPWRLTFLAEPPEDVPVDLLQFGFGTIVRRDWLDDDVFELAGRDAPWCFADDVMLSGYLASKGIRRLCVAGMPLPRLLDHAKVRPLSGDGRMTARYRTAITALASALGIWPRHELAPSFPSRPSLAELRYWSGLALRKAGRFLSAPSGRRA